MQRAEVRKKVIELQEGRLTPQQMREVEDAVHHRISEFLEGYIVIGFVAGAKNEPIFLNVYDDAKTELALQKFAEGMEISHPSDDPDDGYEEVPD